MFPSWLHIVHSLFQPPPAQKKKQRKQHKNSGKKEFVTTTPNLRWICNLMRRRSRNVTPPSPLLSFKNDPFSINFTPSSLLFFSEPTQRNGARENCRFAGPHLLVLCFVCFIRLKTNQLLKNYVKLSWLNAIVRNRNVTMNASHAWCVCVWQALRCIEFHLILLQEWEPSYSWSGSCHSPKVRRERPSLITCILAKASPSKIRFEIGFSFGNGVACLAIKRLTLQTYHSLLKSW